MDNTSLTEIERAIDRAKQNGDLKSHQDQFSDIEQNLSGLWDSMLTWRNDQPPPYSVDSRKRDKWLLEFLMKEPHLLGVTNTACSLSANRGWSAVGTEDFVFDVRNVLHGANWYEHAYKPKGWRHFFRNTARSFYTTDMGAVTEKAHYPIEGNHEDGRPLIGPLGAIWSTDPTRFQLTGNLRKPLKYYSKKEPQFWDTSQYMRVCNNPNIQEEFFGLGYCAVSVLVEVAEIMVAVYEYDKGELGAQAPKGLLLLRNLTQRQWDNAMKERKAKLTAKEQEYYGGISVLASLGPHEIDAKLVALSNLPEAFNRTDYMTLLMYLYSLVFGFAPDEFWPVQVGWLLGRNTEAEIGLERATQKGDADLFKAWQDVFQAELPANADGDPLVIFEFEQRNDRGRQAAASVYFTRAKTAALLYETGLGLEAPLLTRDQALRLLVDHGVVPAEYTDIEEETSAFDTHAIRMKREVRANTGIRKGAALFPNKPIVRYSYPDRNTIVLYESGFDMLKPKSWRGVNLVEKVPPHVLRSAPLLKGKN